MASTARRRCSGDAVYGLPELHREAIRETDLVAVPGCYPTATSSRWPRSSARA